MYKDLINKEWDRYNNSIDKWSMVTGLFPAFGFIIALFFSAYKIHWDHVLWSDFIWLAVIAAGTILGWFIGKEVNARHTSYKSRELSYTLSKYQRWEENSLNAKKYWKAVEKFFNNLPPNVFVVIKDYE